ncbi:MAG: ABC transporter ATP-binding protein [Lachnospiraceae bacterium]
MEEVLLELKGITKEYTDGEVKKTVLSDINLKVNKGEYIAIMGSSGCGKTTLLNIMGGMDDATSGEYLFLGTDVCRMKGNQLDLFRRDNISFVFQQFALMMHYTVEENVELPLKNRKMSKKDKREKINYVLEKVGILDLRKKKVTKISGGEQQRTAIARAMISDNPLILADEPTGSLDSKTSEEIMDYFDQLHEMGRTIIVVTHDLKVANRANKIINICDGKIQSEG